MRTGVVAILGVMAGVGVASAQQANAPSGAQLAKDVTAIQASRYLIVTAGCPGQLQAHQQATGGATVWTAASDGRNYVVLNAKPTGLGIHVEFAHAKTAVKAIELRVRYLPLGLRRMQVDPALLPAAAESPQEREKTFNIDREAATRIGGDLLVGPAATITRVHLMSVTFADGSVWHAPSADACSVEPNRVMEVAAK